LVHLVIHRGLGCCRFLEQGNEFKDAVELHGFRLADPTDGSAELVVGGLGDDKVNVHDAAGSFLKLGRPQVNRSNVRQAG
jgi:hypothetical protein